MTKSKSQFLAELEWRGLLHQTAGTDISEHLATPGRIAYCGFDPTADSLTVGNLVALNLLRLWRQCGHRPIVLLGGATGLVGDPSGKDTERQLLDSESVARNSASIQKIFDRYFQQEGADPATEPIVVNNLDWWGEKRFLEVLRDVGRHFSVNAMIQRESVKERLHNRQHGISYTEFSYMLLQAYDFLHLYREFDCTVQVAGSDQYGNIVSGMDLIRRNVGHENASAFGITAPLVTKSDGKKFGKTEAGAVWLSPERTSPYAFYQFWLNTPDEDVGRFLRVYTMLSRREIESLEAEHSERPHARSAQEALARDVTASVHGEAAVDRVVSASEALFGTGDLRGLDEEMLREVFSDVPHSSHSSSLLSGEGVTLDEVLPETSLASSKREAREFLRNSAISVNGERVDADYRLTGEDLLHGSMILLKRGKKKWHASRWS